MKSSEKVVTMRELSPAELIAVGGGEIIGTGKNGEVQLGGGYSLSSWIHRVFFCKD